MGNAGRTGSGRTGALLAPAAGQAAREVAAWFYVEMGGDPRRRRAGRPGRERSGSAELLDVGAVLETALAGDHHAVAGGEALDLDAAVLLEAEGHRLLVGDAVFGEEGEGALQLADTRFAGHQESAVFGVLDDVDPDEGAQPDFLGNIASTIHPTSSALPASPGAQPCGLLHAEQAGSLQKRLPPCIPQTSACESPLY